MTASNQGRSNLSSFEQERLGAWGDVGTAWPPAIRSDGDPAGMSVWKLGGGSIAVRAIGSGCGGMAIGAEATPVEAGAAGAPGNLGGGGSASAAAGIAGCGGMDIGGGGAAGDSPAGVGGGDEAATW